MGRPAEPERNRQNSELPLIGMFENTLPVSKCTGCIVESNDRMILQMISLQGMKSILDLHPVSTNVLHRTGAYMTRYQRQVLQPCQPLPDTVLHKPVPVLTGPRFHI